MTNIFTNFMCSTDTTKRIDLRGKVTVSLIEENTAGLHQSHAKEVFAMKNRSCNAFRLQLYNHFLIGTLSTISIMGVYLNMYIEI